MRCLLVTLAVPFVKPVFSKIGRLASKYHTALGSLRMSSSISFNEGKVLSVQSHTVHGYVGNKAATLPLQLLGLEIDPLNTVHFSTHSGYGSIRGDATSAAQVDTLVEGLRINGVFEYNYVLSGYARSQDLLESVAKIVRELRSRGNSDVSYFLDPVLGDSDRGFYVPELLVHTYRTTMLPLATVITPNAFEAEKLSGIEIKSESDAALACQALHRLGPRIVVITSMDALAFQDENSLLVVASAIPANSTNVEDALVYKVKLPKIPGSFTGCGDLFMACLLGFMHRNPTDFPTALELTCSTVHSVVERTWKDQTKRELRLIQSQNAIINPTIRFRAEAVPSLAQPISAVIFDMDGTLTLPGNINFASMRARIGLPPGHDILSEIRKLPVDQQAKAVEIVEEEETIALEKMEMQPGLHELIHELRASRIRIAISTRNVGAAVDCFFTTSGLEKEIFDPILTRDFPHNKPDARVALSIAESWNIQPEAIAFVGDSRDDMSCGRDSGCVTVFVEGSDSYKVSNDLVDHRISNLSELPELLRRRKL